MKYTCGFCWFTSRKCADCDAVGDTGDNMHSYMNDVFANEFSFPHIKVIYPTAPYR